jgi:hypothetical protein
MNRRHFLMSSAAAVGSAIAAPKSPSDSVRIACVGLRGRGKSHLRAFTSLPMSTWWRCATSINRF